MSSTRRSRSSTIAAVAPESSPSPLPPEFHEMFKCYICFENLSRPVMCPACSKISCESCVGKWLDTHGSRCPHCRMPLSHEKLVACRFMDELASQVRDAIKANARAATFNKDHCSIDDTDVCPEHNTPLHYFCSTCNDAICSDCAVLSSNHKSHSLEHLSTVYKTHRDSIWRATASLFSTLKSHMETQQTISTQITQISRAATAQHTRHEAVLRIAHAHIQNQAAAKITCLERFARALDAEVIRVRDTMQNLQTLVKVSTRADIVRKCKGVLEIVEKEHGSGGGGGGGGGGNARRDSSSNIELLKVPPDIDLTFQSTLIPAYESAVMVIPNFVEKMNHAVSVGNDVVTASDQPLSSSSSESNSFKLNTVDALYSDLFRTSGISWKLKVYCAGNRGTHVSIFLQMIEGNPIASKYQYKLELVKKSPSSSQQISSIKSAREFTSVFSSGECWGYTKFYPLEMLESNGFIDSVDGSLEIKFSVRPMDFAQKSRDLEWRLDCLENGVAKIEVDVGQILPENPRTQCDQSVDAAEIAASAENLNEVVVGNRSSHNRPQVARPDDSNLRDSLVNISVSRHSRSSASTPALPYYPVEPISRPQSVNTGIGRVSEQQSEIFGLFSSPAADYSNYIHSRDVRSRRPLSSLTESRRSFSRNETNGNLSHAASRYTPSNYSYPQATPLRRSQTNIIQTNPRRRQFSHSNTVISAFSPPPPPSTRHHQLPPIQPQLFSSRPQSPIHSQYVPSPFALSQNLTVLHSSPRSRYSTTPVGETAPPSPPSMQRWSPFVRGSINGSVSSSGADEDDRAASIPPNNSRLFYGVRENNSHGDEESDGSDRDLFEVATGGSTTPVWPMYHQYYSDADSCNDNDVDDDDEDDDDRGGGGGDDDDESSGSTSFSSDSETNGRGQHHERGETANEADGALESVLSRFIGRLENVAINPSGNDDGRWFRRSDSVSPVIPLAPLQFPNTLFSTGRSRSENNES
ncbi:Tripartite motif containing 37 [Physocladia obscura]|uniref:Tripartite motif containing 37 n=1 Tax=Physocladia obscura TaxID=109957 RepID=A0AAD5T7N5_9FUNG|nr:Tripartite motif containing 37 [Physocladia obscura]